ncbi:MAG TPA: hypothetical protein DCP36_05110 [Sporomusaceae bacterium]|nr:hypothetical protein [Sporomusaceae bacterium]
MDSNKDFYSILTLMQVQNTYINQVARLLYQICSDFNIAASAEFHDFTAHFTTFMQNQAGSEGYGRAIHSIQIYHYAILERLLDSEVLAAAEQLEIAISHLELAAREPKIRINPHIMLLTQGICLLEETQLKIIESLETFILVSRPVQLQN